MAEVFTIEKAIIAAQHDTFHGEVITGKAGAVAGGADIDTATNTVTGQVQTTLPKVLRDIGFKPASFNFVTGGTLGVTDADKCIYNPAPAGDDNWYSWGGTLPHDVAPGADPTLTGSGYVPRTDVLLRAEITPSVFESLRRSYAEAGFTLVDGSFEEGGTLASASDVLLHKTSGKAYSGTIGAVSAGTNPAGGGFTDRSGEILRDSVAMTYENINDINPVSIAVGDLINVSGTQYRIEASIPNNGVVSPDCHLIASGKYAVKSLSAPAKRSGVFVTNPSLGHRAGQLRYQKGQGKPRLLTDLSRFKPNTVKELATTVAYVDWAKADNSGNGLSWATARRDILAGVALNPDILYVRGGLYARHMRLSSFSLTKDMAIIAVGGPVVQGSLAKGAWDLVAGKTKTYQLTYMSGLTGTTSSVMDTYVLTNGSPSLLSVATSIDEVEATPGSFYHSGTVTYVHAADDRDLTKHGDSLRLMQSVAGPIITWTGDYRLLMQGIECWHGGTGGSDNVRLISDGVAHHGSSFYNVDCVFGGCRDGGGGNGLAVKDIGMCISERSSCIANRRDGFNYHYGMVGGGNTALAPHYIEIDCIANGNGLGGSEGNNQGSTAHENCVGFRIGGDYSWHSNGGCIVDIDASKCHMVDVSCNNSGVAGALLSADPWSGATGITAEWWIDGMHLSGNPDIANARGDLAMDGYNSRMHYADVVSDKPISTRPFSSSPDDDV